MRLAGVDIGGTAIKIGVVDTGAGLISRFSHPTPVGDPKAVTDLIAREVSALDVAALGVGSAGSVRLDTGLIYSGNLGWWGIPLRKMLATRLNLPIWVDNDAQAVLMAEVFQGELQGAKNAVYLTIGTGIGGALLLSGQPWRGSRNTAAELGHMITHGDGLPCACTRRGCFEMYASCSALSRMAGGLQAPEIFRRARENDSRMLEVLQSYYHEIGIGIVSLISIFNPEVIVLGGGISAAGETLLRGVQEDVRRQLAKRGDYSCGRIVFAKHGNDAGIIGAAMLARHYLL